MGGAPRTETADSKDPVDQAALLMEFLEERAEPKSQESSERISKERTGNLKKFKEHQSQARNESK